MASPIQGNRIMWIIWPFRNDHQFFTLPITFNKQAIRRHIDAEMAHAEDWIAIFKIEVNRSQIQ